jgi:3-deoxy-manno-octulosonate cytidylyltransferase (CMP-KDO synthetase)
MDDLIINVQGDQPLMNPACLHDLILPFHEQPGIVMSTLAFAIQNENERENPKDVKVVMDAEGFALYFSRSPIPFGRDPGDPFDMYKHLGFYAYKRRFLEIFNSLPEGRLEKIEKLEQLRALEYGHRIKVAVTPHDSPEVDLPEDIPRMEGLLNARKP